ncbi:hypothetical protein [Streptomyces spirodelae]|uniref:Uncharacterized protein n=1 Tax=Streptomyces spirodelae TaxID=2812904 RepID=A0ABS3X2R5_9ACTN|nr:hypothetical protein [Streptomyces spirodelae]MBO8189633.1 hypothetical protein [Streptomyces spirodelae]
MQNEKELPAHSLNVRLEKAHCRTAFPHPDTDMAVQQVALLPPCATSWPNWSTAAPPARLACVVRRVFSARQVFKGEAGPCQ